jgi:hypothetical protein
MPSNLAGLEGRGGRRGLEPSLFRVHVSGGRGSNQEEIMKTVDRQREGLTKIKRSIYKHYQLFALKRYKGGLLVL